MNRGGRSSGGYTIVETMIFLAVSGAMFVSAMVLMSGQQGRAEFSQAVRNFETQMQDIANDVSTGYYTNTGNFKCSSTPTSPVLITSGVNVQGQNDGCIYIGRAIQFAPADQGKQGYAIYDLVGKKQTRVVIGGRAVQRDSSSLDEATVTAIYPGSATHTSVPNGSETHTVGYGVTVECVQFNPPAGTCSSGNQISTLLFLTTFHTYSATDIYKLSSGSTPIDLVVPNVAAGGVAPYLTNFGQTRNQVVDTLDQLTQARTIRNPSNGVRICLQSNGSNQYAWVQLGGDQSNFSTSTKIVSGRCP